MAELEESIHSYFWTLQTKRFFLDAQTFIVVITLRRQPWPAHMVTMPFSRHGKSTTNAQEESGQHRANKRLNTSPQNPIKNKLSQSHIFHFSALRSQQCWRVSSRLHPPGWIQKGSSRMSLQWADGRTGWRPPIHFRQAHVRPGLGCGW